MNKENPLYRYADQLNEHGIKLVKKFMQSEEYKELHYRIAKIDADIWKAEKEWRKKIKMLHEAKRDILFKEIPKAKDEYVRKHIEDYKAYLKQELDNESLSQ